MRENNQNNSSSDNAKNGTVILELKGITKSFSGLLANDNIDLVLKSGQIHCILGENGAGKTTLMNIVSGLYHPDKGTIVFQGKKVVFKNPVDAVSLGIGMVHQHLKLVDTMKVWENIILGYEPSMFGFIRKGEAKRKIKELQQKFGLFVDLEAKTRSLTASDRQKTEILKVLYRGAKVIILDEPTSSLTPNEKGKLIQTLKRMSKEGAYSILYISHKLPEVIELSTYLTILRKGKVVAKLTSEEIDDEASLAEKMVGRPVLFENDKKALPESDIQFEVQGLEILGDKGYHALKGINLSVKKGEILGLAGVTGNGQKELTQAIMGLIKVSKGKIIFNGQDITRTNTCSRRKIGFAYIPDDRMIDGIMPELSIKENILVGNQRNPAFMNRWFLKDEEISDYAEKIVKEFNVDTPDINKPVGKLSGGNIQKILLARELSRNPTFILADKPTRGLDVGSQEYVRKAILRERQNGKAILLISEDLDEVLAVSDRIAVIYEGKIIDVLPIENATKETIGFLMAGRH